MEGRIRLLGKDDLEEAWELDREAFNSPVSHREAWLRRVAREPVHGLFADGRLAATAAVFGCGQFFGGRSIPMGGISAVAVAPEHRGKGYASRVVEAALRAARERGQAISSLYPATTALYRQLGWEVAGVFALRRIPARSLRDLPGPGGPAPRRAGDADRADIERCYAEVARQLNGFVDRSQSWWQALAERWQEYSVFLAPGDGRDLDGYVVYQRRGGSPGVPGAPFRIHVEELMARNADAQRSLWRLVGSFSSQVEEVHFRSAPEDPLLLLLPEQNWAGVEELRWMLRVLDAPAAVEARGFPSGLEAQVHLELRDPKLEENSGRFVLSVSKGRGQLAPGGSGSVELAIGDFAPLFSGWASATTLARMGRLRGGGPEEWALLDAAFAGPTPWLVDEF